MAAATVTASYATTAVVSAARGLPRGMRAVVPRRAVLMRAEKSPVDQAVEKVEEKAQDFVKATQENSGLNPDNLNFQPGGATAGPTDDKEWQETFSFSGLLPEIINGRAAMVAMLAAFGAEVATRQPVLKQVQVAPLAIAAAFAVIITASVIPVVRNADLKRQGAGPFTNKAEVYNGRLAMVSFALLLAVETFKAGPGLVP